MTLAKTCHANNVMHDLDKATYNSATTKAWWIAMFQSSIVVIWKKLNLNLKLKLAMLNE